jgi:hypothetical protein
MRLSCWLLAVLAACQSDVSLGGPNTLVRVDHRVSGPDCPAGGVAIHTGLDRDGDTFLDDDEIASTQFVCNGSTAVQCAGGVVRAGTITVREASDWATLDGVACIDGDLVIAGIESDVIPPRPDLQIVTGALVIAGNPRLTSLDGLAQVRQVGGGYLIQSNDALTDIAALGAIKRAGGIQLTGNDALRDLSGLETLVDIDTVLLISNNASLVSVAGLAQLQTTTKSIAIRTNPMLADVALDQLRQAALLEISGNDKLRSVSLAGLHKIDVRLVISNNSALGSIALPELSIVGDFARFEGDPMLTALELPSLLTINAMRVSGDASLTSLAVPNLVFTSAELHLAALPQLTSARFDRLTSVGDALGLANLPLLGSLSGFGALQTIGGAFSLTSAGSLRDFTGLGALETVAGAMTVTGNAQLSSFTGLTRMRAVDGDLTITNNPQLPRATSQAFAQRITVHGMVTVN